MPGTSHTSRSSGNRPGFAYSWWKREVASIGGGAARASQPTSEGMVAAQEKEQRHCPRHGAERQLLWGAARRCRQARERLREIEEAVGQIAPLVHRVLVEARPGLHGRVAAHLAGEQAAAERIVDGGVDPVLARKAEVLQLELPD